MDGWVISWENLRDRRLTNQKHEEELSEERPIVTFALFTFNQEKYIREAVEAAFAQTYSPLEIILSDDSSTDKTFEIMQKIAEGYSGKHRLVLNRNASNLGGQGIGRHVNKVLEKASGELIVFAAGDDISFPHRVSALVDLWVAEGQPCGSLHSAVETLTVVAANSGVVVHGASNFGGQTIRECIRNGAVGVLGASHAITRDIYERFGPLPDGTLFEDRSLAFRSLLAGRVLYCSEELVKYRQHGDNVSGGDKYFDAAKWDRWIRGVITSYDSFQADYLNSLNGNKPDSAVLREITKGRCRAERARLLVTGTMWQRVGAAVAYSKDFETSDRLAFILQHAGLRDSVPYRVASWIWRQYRSKFR